MSEVAIHPEISDLNTPSVLERRGGERFNLAREINRYIENPSSGDLRYQQRESLRALLLATEELAFDFTVTANPLVKKREVVKDDKESRVYFIQTEDGTEIFGSLVSILDAQPRVAKYQKYGEICALDFGPDDKSILGIEVEAGAHRENSSVDADNIVVGISANRRPALSGSAAQVRTQRYPADLDFGQYLHIKTPEGTPRDLAIAKTGRTVARSLIQLHQQIKKTNDPNIQQFKVSAGGKYPEGSIKISEQIGEKGKVKIIKKEVGGKYIDWYSADLDNGFITYQVEEEDQLSEIRHLNLSDAAVSGDRVLVSVVLLESNSDEGSRVFSVSNFLNINVNGENIITNEYDKVNSFNEVYFEDPTEFGLLEDCSNPEKYINYIMNMRESINHEIMNKKEGNAPLNAVICKRLYNLSKAFYLHNETTELAQFFQDPVFQLHQLSERLLTIQFIKEKVNRDQFKIKLINEINNNLLDNYLMDQFRIFLGDRVTDPARLEDPITMRAYLTGFINRRIAARLRDMEAETKLISNLRPVLGDEVHQGLTEILSLEQNDLVQ